MTEPVSAAEGPRPAAGDEGTERVVDEWTPEARATIRQAQAVLRQLPPPGVLAEARRLATDAFRALESASPFGSLEQAEALSTAALHAAALADSLNDSSGVVPGMLIDTTPSRQLAATQDLAESMAEVAQLTADQRDLLVEQRDALVAQLAIVQAQRDQAVADRAEAERRALKTQKDTRRALIGTWAGVLVAIVAAVVSILVG